jgi:uncharacterized protein DUF742
MTGAGDGVPVAAGPLRLVRPYAMTGGRTRASGPELPFETLVLATDHGRDAAASLTWEQRAIVRLCSRPLSIAELASHLAVPLGTARVLVGDLTESGLVETHGAVPEAAGDRPDVLLLERVLDGLRQL